MFTYILGGLLKINKTPNFQVTYTYKYYLYLRFFGFCLTVHYTYLGLCEETKFILLRAITDKTCSVTYNDHSVADNCFSVAGNG